MYRQVAPWRVSGSLRLQGRHKSESLDPAPIGSLKHAARLLCGCCCDLKLLGYRTLLQLNSHEKNRTVRQKAATRYGS
jgi:hypothetical protein